VFHGAVCIYWYMK